MANFIHPAKEDITLTGVLGALADPNRLRIVAKMLKEEGCTSCSNATPCPKMPKSTLSHHFRILREAGLIFTQKLGVEHRNIIRLDDLEARFPGLLAHIIKNADL